MVQPHVKKVEKSILAPRPTRFLPTGLQPWSWGDTSVTQML